MHKQDHRFLPLTAPKKKDLPNLTEADLRNFIMKKYNQRLSNDMNGWFSFFRGKGLPANPSLDDIVKHAIGKNNRTSELMREHGLFTADNQVNKAIAAFQPFLEKEQAQAPGNEV